MCSLKSLENLLFFVKLHYIYVDIKFALLSHSTFNNNLLITLTYLTCL